MQGMLPQGYGAAYAAPAAPGANQPKKRGRRPKTETAGDGGGEGGRPSKRGRPGRPPNAARGGARGGGGGRGGRPPKTGRSKKAFDMDGDINDMLVKPEEQEEYEEEDLGPSHRDIFAKDLPNLMYGFGDSSKPLKESVALLEDMAVEYITDVVHKAMDAATKRCAALLAARGGTMPAATLRREEALKLEDLLHVLRREPHKYARVKELLEMQERIRAARQMTKDDEALLAEGNLPGAAGGGDDMPELDDSMP